MWKQEFEKFLDRDRQEDDYQAIVISSESEVEERIVISSSNTEDISDGDNNSVCSIVSSSTDEEEVTTRKHFTVKEACDRILKGDKEEYVSVVPHDCIETATYFINTSALKDRNDVRIHLSGAMKNNEVQRDYVSVQMSGEEIEDITVLKRKPAVMRNSIYRLTRTYWTSVNTKGFKRQLYELHDSTGKPTKFVILQFIVEGEVPKFTHIHGNTKIGNTPYVRTSKRVLNDIGEHLERGKRPKETFDTVFEEAGGILQVDSPIELPRNTKQIYNVKQSQKERSVGKDKDTMYQLIKECKNQQSLADPYIRVVQSAPEFRCVCVSDLQLMEMDEILTNPSECTIMGVDPTFNLGEFVVTPIAYKNLKLIHRRTGECPTFMGPILIHQTRSESSYDFFASTLTSLHNTLSDTLFIGTDDECAIFNSFSKFMPVSRNLQCKRHMRGNLERKLHSLGINDPYTNQFIKDVFEKNFGLTDSVTDDDFEKKLLELKPIWDLRECEARKSHTAEFHSWFSKYKKDLVKNRMCLPLRISCGLGYSHFTTNANESLNSRLKQKTDYKESEITAFCSKMRELADTQRKDTEKAIIGIGPYQIRPEYIEHVQPAAAWFVCLFV